MDYGKRFGPKPKSELFVMEAEAGLTGVRGYPGGEGGTGFPPG